MSDRGTDGIHTIEIGSKLRERLDRLREETNLQSYDDLLTHLLDQREAMRTLQTLESHHASVSSQTLAMLVNMLAALGPLCLRRDREDREAECVASFLAFLLRLLHETGYQGTGDHYGSIVSAIVSLSIARGGAYNVFRAIECFLKIQKQALANGPVPQTVQASQEERVKDVSDADAEKPIVAESAPSTPTTQPESTDATASANESKTEAEVAREKEPIAPQTSAATSDGASGQQQFKMASLAHLTDPQPAKYPVVSVKQMHAVTWEIKSKVKVDTKRLTTCSLCADASFLYIHNPMQGLVKIGDNGGMQVNTIVHQRNKFNSKAQGSLAVTDKHLYFYSPEVSVVGVGKVTPSISIIDKDTLDEERKITLLTKATSTINFRIFGDGKRIYLMTHTPNVAAANTLTTKPLGLSGTFGAPSGVPKGIPSSITPQELEKLKISLAPLGDPNITDAEIQDIWDDHISVQKFTEAEIEAVCIEFGFLDNSDAEEKSKLWDSAAPKETKEAKDTQAEAKSTEFTIEVYDPETFQGVTEVAPVRILALVPDALNLHPFKEVYFTFGEFYSDGNVIIGYLPPSTYVKTSPLKFTNARVFSCEDGHVLTDVLLDQTIPAFNTLAYSPTSHFIYRYHFQTRKVTRCYNSNAPLLLPGLIEPVLSGDSSTVVETLTFMVYKLMRIAQKHAAFHSTAFLVIEDDQLAPLSTSTANNEKETPAKSEKEKKKAAEKSQVPPTISSSTTALTFSGQLLSYCEDDDLAMFETLQSVILFAITNAIDSTSRDLNHGLILLALKVMKVNLWNVTKSFAIAQTMKGYSESLLPSVGEFLLRVIIDSTLPLSLAREAAETFALGFLLFKRRATERVLFLLHVFQQSRTCERYRLLNGVLLLQLAGWDRVSSILAENDQSNAPESVESPTSAASKKVALSKKLAEKVQDSKKKSSLKNPLFSFTALNPDPLLDATTNPIPTLSSSGLPPMSPYLGASGSLPNAAALPLALPSGSSVAKVELTPGKSSSAPKKVQILNEHAFTFVEQLVALTVAEASEELTDLPAVASYTSEFSPALHFLLVLQKRIVDCVFGVPFLLRYLELLFHQARQFLQLLLNRERDEKEVVSEKEVVLAASGDKKQLQQDQTTSSAPETTSAASTSKPANPSAPKTHERVRVTTLDVLRYTLLGEGLKKLLKKLQHNAQYIAEPDHVLRVLRALVPLVETLDHVNNVFLYTAPGVAKLLASMPPRKEEIVESPHPLPKGTKGTPYTRTLALPLAKAVAVYFDRKSRLAPGDSLRLATSAKAELIVHDGAMPRAPFILDGGTLTFTLHSPAGGAWGFRCVVREFVPKKTLHWGLDLQVAMLAISTTYIKKLLRNKVVVAESLGEFLDSGIFSGGLLSLPSPANQLALPAPTTATQSNTSTTEATSTAESTSTTSTAPTAIVIPSTPSGVNTNSALTTGPSTPVLLTPQAQKRKEEQEWLVRFVTQPDANQGHYWHWLTVVKSGFPKYPGPPNPFIDKVGVLSFAVMVRHCNLTSSLRASMQAFETKTDTSKQIIDRLLAITAKVKHIVMVIRDRCSLGRSWSFAVEEGAGLDYFEEFEGNNTKLKNLCDLKEVVFDLMNLNDCIKKLYEKLVEDQTLEKARAAEGGDRPDTNVFEQVTKPYIERLNFLLSHIDTPSFGNENGSENEEENEYFKKLTEHFQPRGDKSPFRERAARTGSSGFAKSDLAASMTLPSDRVASRSPSHALSSTLSAGVMGVDRSERRERELGPLASPSRLRSDDREPSGGNLLNNANALNRLPNSKEQATAKHHHLSKSINSAEMTKKLLVVEEKEKAFGQRVVGLRNWVDSYHTYKLWQKGGLLNRDRKNDPGPFPLLSSLVTFILSTKHSDLGVEKVDETLRAHNQVARNKYEGYTFFHKILLIQSKFSIIKHISLSTLDGAGHYWDNIKVCSHELKQRLITSFVAIFNNVLSMVTSVDLDLFTRQLSLLLCSISYQSQDAFLLHKSNIFPIICQLFHPTLTTHSSELISLEKKNLNASKEQISQSAWDAFQLMASQCVRWTCDDDDIRTRLGESAAVLALQDQIYGLIFQELEWLNNIYKKSSTQDEAGQHEEMCFQLLTLVTNILNENRMSVKYFSKLNCLKCLTSFLGTRLAPRSQTLIVKLCRQLLLGVDEDGEIVGFLDLLWQRLSSLQFTLHRDERTSNDCKKDRKATSKTGTPLKTSQSETSQSNTTTASSTTTTATATGADQANKESSTAKGDSGTALPAETADYAVLLMSWSRDESDLTALIEKIHAPPAPIPTTTTASTTTDGERERPATLDLGTILANVTGNPVTLNIAATTTSVSATTTTSETGSTAASTSTTVATTTEATATTAASTESTSTNAATSASTTTTQASSTQATTTDATTTPSTTTSTTTANATPAPTVVSPGKQFVAEIASNDYAIVFRGTEEKCIAASAELVAFGSVAVLKEANIAAHLQALSAEKASQTWSLHWLDYHTTRSLASEYLALLRLLANSSPAWKKFITTKIHSSLCVEMPALIEQLASTTSLTASEQYDERFSRAITCLNVLGGCEEVLRVGGAVLAHTRGGEIQKGLVTFIDEDRRNVEVIVQAQEQPTPPKATFEVSCLVPCPEIDVDVSVWSGDVATSLLRNVSLLLTNTATDRVGQHSDAIALLVESSLSTLNSILSRDSSVSQLLCQPEFIDKFRVFVEMAKACQEDSAAAIRLQEDLKNEVWNLLGHPSAELANEKPLSQIIPFLPYVNPSNATTSTATSKSPSTPVKNSESGTSTPTASTTSSTANATREYPSCISLGTKEGIVLHDMIYSRDFYRKGTKDGPEYIVYGNVGIPLDQDYYFEVLVLSWQDGVGPWLSVGLGPEGNNTWEPGHHRFTADMKKCRYNTANPPKPVYEAYGSTSFAVGYTVGCGWIAESKSIYFTINGVSQGVAFSGLTLGEKTRWVPSVGVRNVRVRVNLGHEPYIYHVPNWPVSSFKNPLESKVVMEAPKKTQQQIEQERKEKMAIETVIAVGITEPIAVFALRKFKWDVERSIDWIFEQGDALAYLNEPVIPVTPVKAETPAPQSTSETPVVTTVFPLKEKKITPVRSSQFYFTHCCAYPIPQPTEEEVLKNREVQAIINHWATDKNLIPYMVSIMKSDKFEQYMIDEYMANLDLYLKVGDEKGAASVYYKLLKTHLDARHFYASKKLYKASAFLFVEEVTIGQRLLVKWCLSAPKQAERVRPLLGKEGVVQAVAVHAKMVLLHFYDDENGVLSEWWVPLSNLALPSNATPAKSLLELPLPESAKSEKDVKSETTTNETEQKRKATNHALHRSAHFDRLRLNFGSLQRVFARYIVLAFFSHAGLLLSLVPQPSDVLAIDTKELLFLATQEYEKQHPLDFTASLNIRKQKKLLDFGANGVNGLAREISQLFADSSNEHARPIEKLLAMYAKESTEGKYGMCDVLIDACAQKLKDEIQFVTEQSLYVSKKSQNQSVSRVERVDIARAHSVVVMFDRSETKIHSTIQSDGFVMGFYHDPECSNAIVEITSLATFLPHTLPSKFYHKFTSKTYEQSLTPQAPVVPVTNKKTTAKAPVKPVTKTPAPLECQYLFSVVPSTININIVIDILMALVENCAPHANFRRVLPLLFQYLRATDTPTPLKEVVMSVLAKVIHSLKMQSYRARSGETPDEKENEPIWIALKDLQDEVFLFYKEEIKSNKSHLWSRYMQSLLNLVTELALLKGINTLTSSTPINASGGISKSGSLSGGTDLTGCFDDYLKLVQFLDFFGCKHSHVPVATTTTQPLVATTTAASSTATSEATTTKQGESIAASDSYTSVMLQSILREAWDEVKKDSSKRRLFLVKNIPTTEPDTVEQLSLYLQDIFESNGLPPSPNGLFLCLDEKTQQTYPWCVVESRVCVIDSGRLKSVQLPGTLKDCLLLQKQNEEKDAQALLEQQQKEQEQARPLMLSARGSALLAVSPTNAVTTTTIEASTTAATSTTTVSTTASESTASTAATATSESPSTASTAEGSSTTTIATTGNNADAEKTTDATTTATATTASATSDSTSTTSTTATSTVASTTIATTTEPSPPQTTLTPVPVQAVKPVVIEKLPGLAVSRLEEPMEKSLPFVKYFQHLLLTRTEKGAKSESKAATNATSEKEEVVSEVVGEKATATTVTTATESVEPSTPRSQGPARKWTRVIEGKFQSLASSDGVVESKNYAEFAPVLFVLEDYLCEQSKQQQQQVASEEKEKVATDSDSSDLQALFSTLSLTVAQAKKLLELSGRGVPQQPASNATASGDKSATNSNTSTDTSTPIASPTATNNSASPAKEPEKEPLIALNPVPVNAEPAIAIAPELPASLLAEMGGEDGEEMDEELLLALRMSMVTDDPPVEQASPVPTETKQEAASEPAAKTTESTSGGDAEKKDASGGTDGEAKDAAAIEVDITGGKVTLENLLNIYLHVARHQPVLILDELFALGYDMHLRPNHHLTFEEAINAEVAHLRAKEDSLFIPYFSQLVNYIEAIFNDTQGLMSPLALTPSHIIPFSYDSESLSQTYPLLVDVDVRQLRLDFVLLRLFNFHFKNNVGLINLDGSTRVCSNLFQLRHLIFHSVKMDTFYDILERTPAIEGQQPTVTLNRKAIASAIENAKKINEPVTEEWMLGATAFGQAYTQLQKTKAVHYRQVKPPSSSNPHYSLLINLEGEMVEGIRGPYSQFFTDVSKELEDVKPLLPLIIPCPNAVSSMGKNQDKFVLCSSSNHQSQLDLFKFLGQMMGMALRTNVILPLSLHMSVWKRLVGMQMERQDLIDQDELFYKLLCILSTVTETEFETLDDIQDLTFTIRLSDMSVKLLKPGGEKIPLTFANKDEWIRLALNVRLNESQVQLESILSGIGDIIPLPLLSLLTPQDLEWSVSGKPVIDVNLLKRHTKLHPSFNENTPVIRYFWQVLHSLTQEERIKFIRFVYAQERLPVDDQEFIRTGTKMLIKPYSGKAAQTNPDKCFPRADTCFFSLSLPQYSSPEVLKEKLLTSILYASDSMNADDPQRGLPTNF